MPYQMFSDLFPETAAAETRSITIFGDHSETGLPAGEYGFGEMFCNERGCDCRRVFFYVMVPLRKEPRAVIAWGWESASFYAKWMGIDDPETIAELKGPVLNLGSPQTELAPALLDFTRDALLQDKAYVDRIKRHYLMFRRKIEGQSGATSKPIRRTRKRKRKRKG